MGGLEAIERGLKVALRDQHFAERQNAQGFHSEAVW